MWKTIKGFEKLYVISDNGDIKSLLKKRGFYKQKEKLLKQKITKFGYKTTRLWKNNKGKDVLVHRLVAETFISNKFNKPQVNHKDGNKLNNNANNLEWMTSSENLKHAFKTGLKSLVGNKHNNRKLSQVKVNNIRKSILKNIVLAKKYRVSPATICLIRKNKLWKQL